MRKNLLAAKSVPAFAKAGQPKKLPIIKPKRTATAIGLAAGTNELMAKARATMPVNKTKPGSTAIK
jgi:hypothetical protein